MLVHDRAAAAAAAPMLVVVAGPRASRLTLVCVNYSCATRKVTRLRDFAGKIIFTINDAHVCVARAITSSSRSWKFSHRNAESYRATCRICGPRLLCTRKFCIWVCVCRTENFPLKKVFFCIYGIVHHMVCVLKREQICDQVAYKRGNGSGRRLRTAFERVSVNILT